jgi:hypothetical protein
MLVSYWLYLPPTDIPPEHHLLIQSVFQCHIDNSASKTINLPADASPDEIEWIYQTAWNSDLKGLPFFAMAASPPKSSNGSVGEEALQYEHSAPCDPGEYGLQSLWEMPLPLQPIKVSIKSPARVQLV